MITPTLPSVEDVFADAFGSRAAAAQAARLTGLLDAIIYLECARRARRDLEQADLLAVVPAHVSTFLAWIGDCQDAVRCNRLVEDDVKQAYHLIQKRAGSLRGFLQVSGIRWQSANLRRSDVRNAVECLVVGHVPPDEMLHRDDRGTWHWATRRAVDLLRAPAAGRSDTVAPFVVQDTGAVCYAWLYVPVTPRTAFEHNWPRTIVADEITVAMDGDMAGRVVRQRTLQYAHPDGTLLITTIDPAHPSMQISRILAAHLLDTDTDAAGLAQTRALFTDLEQLRYRSAGAIPALDHEQAITLLATKVRRCVDVATAHTRDLQVSMVEAVAAMDTTAQAVAAAQTTADRIAPACIHVRGRTFRVEYTQDGDDFPAVLVLPLDTIAQIDLDDADLRSQFSTRGYRVRVDENPQLLPTLDAARVLARRICARETLQSLHARAATLEHADRDAVVMDIRFAIDSVARSDVDLLDQTVFVLKQALMRLEQAAALQCQFNEISTSMRRLPAQGSRPHTITADEVQALYAQRRAIDSFLAAGDLDEAADLIASLAAAVRDLGARYQLASPAAKQRPRKTGLHSLADLQHYMHLFAS